MHIVAVAWMFVVVLMALTEATSSQGSLLGALITFVLYGLLPLAIVLYLMGTPVRRRARKAAEAQADAAAAADASSTPAGDGSGQAAGAGLAPVRKEP
jgi:uncharacterized membrane protein